MPAEADCPDTTFAVDRGCWTNLSAEFADMVAPPITVSSLPMTAPSAALSTTLTVKRRAQQARSRSNMPVERHRQPTR